MSEEKKKKYFYDGYPNINGITFEKLDLLGFDDNDQLYWKGHPVKVEKRFKFSFWQGLFAIAASIGALLSGIVALLEYIYN